jgi:hypothetical protein
MNLFAMNFAQILAYLQQSVPRCLASAATHRDEVNWGRFNHGSP